MQSVYTDCKGVTLNRNFVKKIPSIFNADCYLEAYQHEKCINTRAELCTDVLDIYDTVIYPELEFDLCMNQDLGTHGNEKILGKTIVSDNIILIDRTITKHDPRFAFTLAHEIGHAAMHRNINQAQYSFIENTPHAKYDFKEIEANCFAEHLLMPQEAVKYRFEEYYEIKRPYIYNGPGEYGINGEKVNIESLFHLSLRLATPLTHFFSNISKESLAYRLSNIGLIKNYTKEIIYTKTYTPNSIAHLPKKTDHGPHSIGYLLNNMTQYR
jgi:Zn-dependent peptidase ImmA (M78 family)